MKLIVGIDFGTSTTVLRYREENSDEIHVLKDADNKSDIIPTLIYRYPDGRAEYGIQAVNSFKSNHEGLLINNFKMDLLDLSKRKQAVEQIEEFLHYVYGLFRAQTKVKGIHYTDMDINISYPAKWDDEMVKVMKEAVVAAGFEGNLRGVKEPEAAMRNMVWTHLNELQKDGLLGANRFLRIFLLDMGAGTTDITIFKLSLDEEGLPHMTETFLYPSKTENILCGGREIDEALQKYMLDYLKEKEVENVSDWITLEHVKTWKEESVSPLLKKMEPLKFMGTVLLALKLNGKIINENDLYLDRADFEHVTKKHWKNLYQLIVSAMIQCPYTKPEDIDLICLTGGHSAWYTIPKLFKGEGVCNSIAKEGTDPDFMHFSKLEEEPWRWKVMEDGLPHECVARGLCLMDKRMVVDLSSSNNVWGKISINGQSGELIQVVNKLDDILPVSREISSNAMIERNHVWGDLNIDALIEIYTGETLENAEHRVYKMKEGDNSVLGRLVALLFIFPIFKPIPINAKVTMTVTMTEEGTLVIDGEFKVDNKSLKFSDKDLEIVKAE